MLAVSVSALCFLVHAKAKASGQDVDHLDFKIVVEPKDSPSFTVILVASSRQEKAAWTSDISQVRPGKEPCAWPEGGSTSLGSPRGSASSALCLGPDSDA